MADGFRDWRVALQLPLTAHTAREPLIQRMADRSCQPAEQIAVSGRCPRLNNEFPPVRNVALQRTKRRDKGETLRLGVQLGNCHSAAHSIWLPARRIIREWPCFYEMTCGSNL